MARPWCACWRPKVDVRVREPTPHGRLVNCGPSNPGCEVPHGRRPGTDAGVFLLITAFRDMHVQPDTIVSA